MTFNALNKIVGDFCQLHQRAIWNHVEYGHMSRTLFSMMCVNITSPNYRFINEIFSLHISAGVGSLCTFNKLLTCTCAFLIKHLGLTK